MPRFKPTTQDDFRRAIRNALINLDGVSLAQVNDPQTWKLKDEDFRPDIIMTITAAKPHLQVAEIRIKPDSRPIPQYADFATEVRKPYLNVEIDNEAKREGILDHIDRGLRLENKQAIEKVQQSVRIAVDDAIADIQKQIYQKKKEEEQHENARQSAAVARGYGTTATLPYGTGASLKSDSHNALIASTEASVKMATSAPGRPNNESYDVAYARMQEGMSLKKAYEKYLEEEKLQNPDIGTYDNFKTAMRRRRKKASN